MKNEALLFIVVLLVAVISVATTRAESDPVNLLSLQEGALPVSVPPTYSGWNAENLLDDSPKTGWASEDNRTQNNVFVFELAETATLESFEFDNAAVDDEGASAKNLLVEVSTTSPETGYTVALEASLEDKTDGQRFPADVKTPAQWLRLTLIDNHGSGGWTELFSFRGFGVKPPTPEPADISGTYESSYSQFHIRRQGTALTGCYEYEEGLINGTIEGRVMKLTWQESGGADDCGPAVMVFSRDGQSFQGFFWERDNEKEAPSGNWDGRKVSSEVGGCPHWAGSVGGELKKKLGAEKRARLYGILFDFNSATLRPESRPVLDEVRALLIAEPSWVLTIEGHTDAIGGDDQNLALSRKRADAVKTYLVEAGIAAERLRTEGYGESKPVADNATELGRAQNRRVELVRD